MIQLPSVCLSVACMVGLCIASSSDIDAMVAELYAWEQSVSCNNKFLSGFTLHR